MRWIILAAGNISYLAFTDQPGNKSIETEVIGRGRVKRIKTCSPLASMVKPLYDLEVERVSDEIRERHARRILLQLPEGLRPRALQLARELEERADAEVLILGNSCYGACDIALKQLEAVEADLLVHYGHSRMLPDRGTPILYVEAKIEVEVAPLVEIALPLMEGWKTAGLAASVQHVHQLDKVAEALRLRGMRAIIGAGRGRTPHDGQVVGCDYSSARYVAGEVDGFLFVGGGQFHPLGLAVATGKPVVAVDPYLSSVAEFGEDVVRRLAMKRMASLTAAKGARHLGIIVSLKPGQFELSAARSLRDKLERQGRGAAIICIDEVRSEALANFSEVEAFINTACPRIAVDGVANLRRPILTVDEALVLLGERGWDEIWPGSYVM